MYVVSKKTELATKKVKSLTNFVLAKYCDGIREGFFKLPSLIW